MGITASTKPGCGERTREGRQEAAHRGTEHQQAARNRVSKSGRAREAENPAAGPQPRLYAQAARLRVHC